MPPLPKDPKIRQRRNRAPTAAALAASPAARSRALPVRDDGKDWHPQAVAVWTEAWASPMADEYLEADVPGLILLVHLTHEYYGRPSGNLAAEIRQQRLSYGLDPMARRRLQWEVARAESATRKPTSASRAGADPRLRLVSGG
jgi:hypothetical protein